MDNNRQDIGKVIRGTTFILKGLCILGLGLSLFAKEIVQLMTSNEMFYIAWIAIPIIVLAALINSLYIFYGNTLFYNKKGTKYIWMASLSGNIVNVFICIFLTSYFDFVTPAIALVIQRTITAVVIYFISRKIEPVDFELFKMLGIIFLFICATSIGLSFDILYPNSGINIMNILFKIIVAVIAVTILFYEDRSVIINLLKKKKKR